MNDTATPRRRRAVVATTAVLTALATVASITIIAASSHPSQAATASTETGDPTPNSAAVDLVSPPSTAPVTDASAVATPPAVATGSIEDITNVVLILADDLDWATFNEVPRLAALKDKGMTFVNQTVTDSLCCPSRVSIMRGQYIHNHHVVSNSSATGGGWPTFKALGEQKDCLPVWLKNAGRTTGMFGKYLNEWPSSPQTARVVPPGWTNWAVPATSADSYRGYDYLLNSNGRLRQYGSKPKDFLNDVLTTKAVDFIRTAPEGFFAELAVFNPHMPAPVALRNRATHLDAVSPRTPNYGIQGVNPPSWMRRIGPMNPVKQTRLDLIWRQRAQSAESVADSVDAVMATLTATGRTANTLVIVTSDNGYHAGAHGLSGGKRTAYREDTVVPTVMIGPGIAPGVTIDGMTSTIDLAPTLSELLGTQAPAWVDGRSLVPMMASAAVPADWRTAVLSESEGVSVPGDPDYAVEDPPPYTALRTSEYLFVVYRDGERELYDLAADPYEINNIAASADTRLVAALYSQMQALKTCSGPSCRTADTQVLPALTVTTAS